MNYEETLEFLYAQLPMFQRVGAQAYKPSLDNTIALCEAIGNPQHRFKSVHIAGTNGKGSSSHLIASILQSSGYKTGLYTSPHLVDFRERVKIDGRMVTESFVCNFVNKNMEVIQRIQPSFFEMCVAMAFQYFAEEKVDIAVIEVGMGGRLDSTNIINPELCLITNIGYDHMQFLGNTLPKIAGEKAGIIKPNTPVIISQEQAETEKVFLEIAAENNAAIYFAEKEYDVKYASSPNFMYTNFSVKSTKVSFNNVSCSLLGSYQEKNLAGVLKSIEVLREKGFLITEKNILEGIKNVKSLTGLRGRWDVLRTEPLTVADTGHNEDGIKMILKQLELNSYDTLHWVWGMVNDKEPDKVFVQLPITAHYYFCKPAIPRGLDANTCKNIALAYGLQGEAYKSVGDAYQAALENAKKNDIILIAGSTFVVAEVL